MFEKLCKIKNNNRYRKIVLVLFLVSLLCIFITLSNYKLFRGILDVVSIFGGGSAHTSIMYTKPSNLQKFFLRTEIIIVEVTIFVLSCVYYLLSYYKC